LNFLQWIANYLEAFPEAKTLSIIVGEWDFNGEYSRCHGSPRSDLESIDLKGVLKILYSCEDKRHSGLWTFKYALAKYYLRWNPRELYEAIEEEKTYLRVKDYVTGTNSSNPAREPPKVSLRVAVTPPLKRRLTWIQEEFARQNKQSAFRVLL